MFNKYLYVVGGSGSHEVTSPRKSEVNPSDLAFEAVRLVLLPDSSLDQVKEMSV